MVASTAASRKGAATSKVADDEVDLLADITAETANAPDDDEDFDLLSDLSGSDAVAWMPWDEEDQPTGIQGRAVHIGTVTQDAKFGGDEVPYVEIQAKDGTVWGIRGYATVLKNQMQREIDNGLSTGDLFAVAYLGVKENRKKDNEYKNFKVLSKRQ
jgi:hypothetical protein